MPGEIVQLSVSEVYQTIWSPDWRKPSVSKINLKNLNKDDTYMMIFSNGQLEAKQKLLETGKIKVIYEGKKAINRTPGHGTMPRNTLLVFELNDGTEEGS